MFETAAVPTGATSQRIWTTGLGVVGQALAAACAVAVSLLYPGVLPKPQALFAWLEAPAPEPPKPTAPDMPTTAVRAIPTQMPNGVMQMPLHIPDKVEIIEDPPLPVGYNLSLMAENAVGLKDLASAGPLGPPAAPVAQPKPATLPPEPIAPKRYKVGGLFVAGVPIHRVEPEYPEIARKARIQGRVELEAVIGIDGRIRELKLLGGQPLLVRAAMDAVKQWVYRPYMLDGDPVEMVQPIIVTFTLR